MMEVFLRRLLILLLLVWPHVVAAGEEARSEFLAAFEAADPGARDGASLRAYPLYPWLEAERFRVALARGGDGALDSRVGAFLEQHGDAPYTQALRGAWWDSLHARRRWSELLLAFGGRPAAPARLCQWLRALLAAGEPHVLREDALYAWKQGQPMPDECDPAFTWLRERGLLTAERIEARLRLALKTNKHRPQH
jgi:soluble lytic murein transglycosylase